MTKEFIWDFDGTLFNTYPHTAAAFCEILKRKGVNISEAQAMRQLKISIRAAFDFYNFDEKEKEEFYELENNIDFPPCGMPYEGIPEALELITLCSGRNYLYTLRDKIALKYLDRYFLTPYFSDFVTREDGFPFKPAPDGVEYIIKKHSLDKNKCMLLGDSAVDMGAAAGAGIKGCLFDEYGYLDGVEADFHCRSISQMSSILFLELS